MFPSLPKIPAPGILIASTLDTKAVEIGLLLEALAARDIPVIVVDCGVLGSFGAYADIPASLVAQFGGADLDWLRAEKDREHSLSVMLQGLRQVVRKLMERDSILGVLGFGGGTNAALASAAIDELPFGLPKVVVSTTVSGNTSSLIGYKDVVLVHSVVDVLGSGTYIKDLAQRAAAIMSALLAAKTPQQSAPRRKTIGLTSFGSTTTAANHAYELLTSAGFDVLAFHARGTGGRALERFVLDGAIDAVLDLTTTEVADEIVGGISSAGPNRLEAAGRLGLPQVVLPGAVDMVNFGPRATIPSRFADRLFLSHTPSVTLMRSSPEENVAIARFIAERLLQATGAVAMIVPRRGYSAYDAPGAPFFDPAADAAFLETFRRLVGDRIEVDELDANINDAMVAETAVRKLLSLLPQD